MDCKQSEKLKHLFEESLNPSECCVVSDAPQAELGWVPDALYDIKKIVGAKGFSEIAREIELARLRVELMLRKGQA